MATPKKEDKSALDVAVQELIDLLGQSGGFMQQWKDGPWADYRALDFSDATYLDCLRAVEDGPIGATGLPALVQRMRRMSFSIFTFSVKKPTSLLFDLTVNPCTNLLEPPLTIDHVGIDELNTLFGTRNMTTLLGSKIGISHAWGAIDVAINGILAATPVMLAVSGPLVAEGVGLPVPIEPLVGWLGDLANAVRIYETGLPKLAAENRNTADARRRLMLTAVEGTVGKGDLLGDLDGIAIGYHWARSPHAFTASSFLQDYYANDRLARDLAAQLGRPSAAHRFHYFLKYVNPPLPSGGLDSSPFLATFDKAAARAMMPDLLARAADVMLRVAKVTFAAGTDADGNRRLEFFYSDHPEALRANKPLQERLDAYNGRDGFLWLCDEFCRFIDEGVRTGDATWPPVLN